MEPEHLDKLIGWYREEIEDLMAEGASPEILKEPVFARMVLKSMMQRHLPEIRADPDLLEPILREASPEEFFR